MRKYAILGACSFLIFQSVAEAQPNTQPGASEQLWRVYASQIAGFANGDSTNGAGFQIVPVLAVAGWGSTGLAAYNRDAVWCDIIPSWGPFYAASASNVSNIYGNYLSSLSIPVKVSAADAKTISKARTAWANATKAKNELQRKVGVAWTSFHKSESSIPPASQTSYDSWFADNYGAQEGQAEQNASNEAASYAQVMNTVYKGYASVAQAIIDYDNLAYQTQSTSGDGKTLPHRSCTISNDTSPDLDAFVNRGKANETAGKYATSLQIDSTKGQIDSSEWHVSGGASYFGFIHGSGGYSHSEFAQHVDKFTATIKFRNLEKFTITRQKWFTPGVINLLHDDVDFVPGAVANPAKLWGQNGAFRLLPVELIVAYKPSITIGMSDDDYKSAHSAWSGGGGFSVGPFSVNANAGGSFDHISWDDQSKSVTVDYASETPYVIAVRNEMPPSL